jgi:hypothetical protein
MTASKMSWIKGISLILCGLAIGAGGIYVGETDDSPGAGVGGLVLMLQSFSEFAAFFENQELADSI